MHGSATLNGATERDDGVRAVRRALAILRAFGPSDGSLPLGEIARRADLDKATARRLLRTLMSESLITQQGMNRDYSLSPAVLELSAGATPVNHLRRRAQSLLASVVAESGATSFLVVPHKGTALCIESMAGGRNAPPPVAIGVRLPMNISPAPRVLMAHLSAQERTAVLSRPFPALTAATPTDPSVLSSMVDLIRERGWEASKGHVVWGISGLAVPVRDASGEVIAALGIAGADDHILVGGQPRHLDMVLAKVRDWERRYERAAPEAPDPRPHVALMAEQLLRSSQPDP